MTDQLDLICDQIRHEFDQKTALRDEALKQARELTRHASLAIRAIHREDHDEAQSEIHLGRELAQALTRTLRTEHPELFFAGYTQDAIKEYC